MKENNKKIPYLMTGHSNYFENVFCFYICRFLENQVIFIILLITNLVDDCNYISVDLKSEIEKFKFKFQNVKV